MKRLRPALWFAVPALLATLAPAREAGVRPSAVAISTSHRFVASGMTSGENVALAEAAEEVLERLEGLTGVRVPLPKTQPVRLLARWDEGAPSGRVLRAQGWADFRLAQKLILVHPDRVDQEDVLEGLCWLLLNRCAAGFQSAAGRASRLAEVPDWLAAGAAQNLYVALRARNNETAVRCWQSGAYPAVADLLKLDILPAGRSTEKAFCGVLVEWLAALPNRSAVFTALFEQCARGEAITPEVLRSAAGLPSAGDLEKHLALQIAQETQIKRYWGGVSAAKIEALRDLLAVRPEALGFGPADGMPAEMTPAELADHRGARWLAPLARALSLKARGLALGEVGDFVGVADAYARYFGELARTNRGLARLFTRKTTLLRLLHRADTARAAFEREWGEAGMPAAQSDRR